MRRHCALTGTIVLLVLLSACAGNPAPAPEPGNPPTGVVVESVAEGLDTPWALAFAPDGRLFVTERPGRVRVIENGQLRPEPWATLPVVERGESGLMGIAIHPSFPEPPHVFVCYSVGEGTPTENRIVRLSESAGAGTDSVVAFAGIPAALFHNGCRLKIGPDGKLWATTGDAANPARSQDDTSAAGKILRLELDGSIPSDNPNPASAHYTKGHRNVQGLAFHPLTNRPYITEHGQDTDDEINLLKPGRNYAWPLTGRLNNPAFEDPLRTWTPTIAPAGATFFVDPTGNNPEWHHAFFFVTLKERDLRAIHLDPQDPTMVVGEDVLYDHEYGRLRDVVQGPDGNLYFTTSNHDGRGQPQAGDDHVYRIRVA